MPRQRIFESYAIRDILKHISFDTAVLFDLDNTIMEGTLDLGSDQWFCGFIDIAANIISDKEEASSLVLAIYQAVQHHVATQAVEPVIVKLIKALQDIGIPVYAITARGPVLIETTLRQLKSINIDFSVPGEQDKVTLQSEAGTFTYFQHIIFCDGNDKGQGFKAFTENFNIHPAHLVMADDRKKHLSSVLKVAEADNIPFDGVHYRFADAKVAKHNMVEAHRQLAELLAKLPLDVQEKIDRLSILPKTKKRKFSEVYQHTDSSHPDTLFSPPNKRRKLSAEIEDRHMTLRKRS